MKNITRRSFVIKSSRALAFLPIAGAVGCFSNTDVKLNSEDALKRLIYIVGPWTVADKLTAENFAKRFLKSGHAEPYLPKAVKLIESLIKQISEVTFAVKEISLDTIPEEEQQALLNLTKQLYSFVEVRFYVSNEPTWGECQENSKWHTKIPS